MGMQGDRKTAFAWEGTWEEAVRVTEYGACVTPCVHAGSGGGQGEGGRRKHAFMCVHVCVQVCTAELKAYKRHQWG
jgi:hypothetical protein